jgi:hypothetical protein
MTGRDRRERHETEVAGAAGWYMTGRDRRERHETEVAGAAGWSF